MPGAVGVALGDLLVGGGERGRGGVADGGVLVPELGGRPQPPAGGVDGGARARP